MTLTMENVLNIFEGLKRLATLTEDKTFKAPFTLSYKIAKYMRIFATDVDDFNKVRQGIFTRLGTEDTTEVEKDGIKTTQPLGTYSISAENRMQFNHEMDSLLKERVSHENVFPLKVTELNSLIIDSNTTLMLLPLIEDDTLESS